MPIDHRIMKHYVIARSTLVHFRPQYARCPAFCVPERRHSSTLTDATIKFAVVGSGPAGFYSASHLLKHVPNATVDMFEALPVPFGLVRYGVAPDHPEVKNVIHKFTATAQDSRFRFIGNVRLSTHITLSDLSCNYHSTILAYGASSDRKLGLPNEESTKNVISAREFVGWYNGHPSCNHLNVDLSCDTAVIIGQGNVAMDIARILLTPIDKLRKTDICSHALQKLEQSCVKKVHVVGRRGVGQVAFTPKEIRELLALPVNLHINKDSIVKELSSGVELPRPKKRVLEILLKASSTMVTSEGRKDLYLDFNLIPHALHSTTTTTASGDSNALTGITFENSILSPSMKAVGTGTFTTLNTGLLFKSIGYKALPVPGLLFDDVKGVVPNDRGRVIWDSVSQAASQESSRFSSQERVRIPNLYVSGWLKRGPTGVIASTMFDAFETADTIMQDINSSKTSGGLVAKDAKMGFDGIKRILESQNHKYTTWQDWEMIDRVEIERGIKLGKEREKIVDVDEMMKLVGKR